MKPGRRSWLQRGVLALNVVLIVASVTLAAVFRSSYQRVEAINRFELSGSLTEVEDEGGPQVLNVLLVGSDSSAGLDPDDPVQAGRQGERNGDVIIVAHLDERSDTAALLSFPRDLWVPIAGTDSEAKINSAYRIGGAETLIDTIEEQFGIPINHYVQVDFAGFRGLVDAVGSVPVWFDTPARDWNAVEGITQTGFEVDTAGCNELGPEQALAYVRSRYYQTLDEDLSWVTDPRSDLGRIERQQDFLRRLLTRAVDQGARNPFTLRSLIDVGLELVTIDQDLSPQDLLDLGQRFSSFDPGELGTYSVPADLGTVGTASVLFADDEALEPVLELFRGAPIDDPSTVRVRISYGAGIDGTEVTGARDRLSDAGFDVVGATQDDVEPGIGIRYAAGTIDAAREAAGIVWPGAELVFDDTLDGRDLVVTLGEGPEPVDEPGGEGGPGSPTTTEAPGGTPAEDDGTAPPPTTIDPATACR